MGLYDQAQTVSVSKGAAASFEHIHRHDLDAEILAKNLGNPDIDLSRIKWNVDLLEREFYADENNAGLDYQAQTVREFYAEKFGTWDCKTNSGTGALAEYNRKQIENGRPNRIIKDYFDYCCKSKTLKPIHEEVVQIGNFETNNAKDPENRIGSNRMYADYLKRWRKQHPNLHITSAVIHNDESTPHLHVQFVPWVDQNSPSKLFQPKMRADGTPKRQTGVRVKNSLRDALKACGYKKHEYEGEAGRNLLAKIMNENGIERLEMGLKNHHMTPDDFKYMCSQEQSRYNNDPALFQVIYEYEDCAEQLANCVIEQNEDWNKGLEQFKNQIDEYPRRKIPKQELKKILENSVPKKNLNQNFGFGIACAKIQELKDKVAAIPSAWRQNIIFPIKNRVSELFDWQEKYRNGQVTKEQWAAKFPKPKYEDKPMSKADLAASVDVKRAREISDAKIAEKKIRRQQYKNQ